MGNETNFEDPSKDWSASFRDGYDKVSNTTENLLHQTSQDVKSPKIFVLWSILLGLWILFNVCYMHGFYAKLLSALANRFMLPKTHKLSLGTITISPLSGVIVIKDLLFQTDDYRLSSSYCLIVFRYWQTFSEAKKDTKGAQKSQNSRLYISLQGFDLHIFNRTWLYGEVLKIFNKRDKNRFFDKNDKFRSSKSSKSGSKSGPYTSDTSDLEPLIHDMFGEPEDGLINSDDQKSKIIRGLIPSVDLDLKDARFSFGNEHLDYSLVVTAKAVQKLKYTTVQASNRFDLFMHQVVGEVKQFKICLLKKSKAQSKSHLDLVDDQVEEIKNRIHKTQKEVQGGLFYLVDEVFTKKETEPVVDSKSEADLSSANKILPILDCEECKFVYSWDEVENLDDTAHDEQQQNHNQNPKTHKYAMIDPPRWDLTIDLNKKVDVHYSANIDRYRDQLHKFFYPMSYASFPIDSAIRQPDKFKLQVNLNKGGIFDLSYNKRQNSLKLDVKDGTVINVNTPFYAKSNEKECKMVIDVDMNQPLISSDILMPKILSAENCRLVVGQKYAMVWNGFQ